MLVYKIDVMQELAKKGWNPKRIRDAGRIGEAALTKIRAGAVVSSAVLNALCEMTGKQPGQLIAWKPDPIPAADADAGSGSPAPAADQETE